MSQKVLKIHPDDNVIVALKDLPAGETVDYQGVSYTMLEDIPAKHKFFAGPMRVGDEVIMYGVLVGKTQKDLQAGNRMTVDNVKHAAEPYQYRGSTYQWKSPDVSKFKGRTFRGYHRSDGRVGTANYWLFIPTVFCENRNLDVIREALQNELGYAVTDKYKQYAHHLVEAYEKGGNIQEVDLSPSTLNGHRPFKNVDGIKFLNHEGGCGAENVSPGFPQP